MNRKLFNRFIKPLAKDSELAEREIVLNYLLVGIFLLSTITLVDSIFHPLISDKPFYPERALNDVLTMGFIVVLYFIARIKQHYRVVAIILTSLMVVFACAVSFSWGLFNPYGLLLFSLSVVMAGVLIGARYSLYVACFLTAAMLFLELGVRNGSLKPDISWMKDQPYIGDVIALSTIIFVIALVSWLFNRQMEMSLRRARRSEKALQRQKELLEIKVEKRAQQLEAAQLEKMQELYRFAELGRLSTALFHDLANHLSTVSLDIEGLSSRDQSDIMRRISQNVGHIDVIVKRVREQIRGKSTIEVFNITDEINEVLKILTPAARQARVDIVVKHDKSVLPSLSYKGDTIRFRQIVLNLVVNGIEAYESVKDKRPRQVVIHLERHKKELQLQVVDNGPGIPMKELADIFRPFYTTKHDGMGIGLFIVKQVIENDFDGAIDLESSAEGTSATVTLPRSYYVKASRR